MAVAILAVVMVCSCIFAAFADGFGGNTANALSITQEEASQSYVDSLRYGYNVTAGKSIYEIDAFQDAAPILKPFSEGLYKYVNKREVNTKSDAGNYEANNALSIAKQYSRTLSGGIEANVRVVQADLNATFDLSNRFAKTYDEYYAVYYQEITRNTYVIMESVDLRDYLTDEFKSDMAKIKTETDASNFIQRYGTHLFTGLKWGGMLQVSNYQQTQSRTERISTDIALSAKIGNTIAANGSFSFAENVEAQENSSNKTSRYRCTLYGGKAVTSATVDQVFKYNSGELSGKGNYVYKEWVDSINENQNLAIIGRPDNARYVPVWDLLPDGTEYLAAKRCLRNAYTTLCGDQYDEFLKKYPTTSREIGESGVETGVGTIDGYTMTYAGNTSYNQLSKSATECSVYRGSTISMNCTTDTIPAGMKNWKVEGNPDWVEVVDSVSGIFRIKGNAIAGRTFNLQLYSGDTLAKDLGEIFVVKSASFSGGEGTEESPYILSTKEDLLTLSADSSLWEKSYRLSTDIDLENTSWSPLGVSDNLFGGTFDGNHCTISNVKINSPRDKAVGLFGYIDKNATIKDLFVNNVTIGYEDKQMLESDVSYAGGLVGNSKGTLENCLVDNLCINARCVISNSQNNLSVGGLVGTASGTIKQCGVRNCAIISGYLMDELVGDPNADANKVKDSINEFGKNPKTAIVYVGGFIGEASDCKISNCYVNSVAKLSSQAATYTTTVSVGGLCGYVGTSTKVDTSVVGEITKFLSSVVSNNSRKCKSSFVGDKTNTLEKDAVPTFSKCYAQKVDGIESGVDSGCTVLGEITWSAVVNENGLSKTIWCAEKGTQFPILIKQEIGTEALSYDVSKAKTEFYYGESFDIAGVSVSGTYRSSGEEIQLDVFSYDSSAYNPMQEGTYKIKIYAMGKETAYEVVVRKIKVVNIKVEAIDPSKTYYVDETIDVNDYKVSYVLEDGSLLDPTAEKLSYVQYPTGKIVADNTRYTYALGDNEIIFNCGSMSASTIVEGIEKVVSSIRIGKNPKKMSYIAGETFNREEMEVIANYTDGTSEIVDDKELEIIGERISEGENEVIISYGAYKTAAVVVQGEPAPSETYIVKFVDYDGSLISEKTYTSGSSVNVPSNPTRSSDNTYKYTFSGWSPNVATTCTANATYTAQYTQTYMEYTIVFVGEDGREIARNTYHYGDTVTAPELPDKTIGGVKYVGSWDSDFVAICNGNKTYTAKYTKSGSDVGDGEYAIVFKYDDGTIIETQHHNFGEDVVAPINVTKASDNVYSYKFVGWDKTVKNVCIANAEYIAVFEKIYIEYTIKFVDSDGTIISSNTYHYGDTVTAPKLPDKTIDGVKYVGSWGSDFVAICNGNKTYTAQYTKNGSDSGSGEYTVVFKYDDGTIIESQHHDFGDDVVAPTNVTKESDKVYSYKFVGWDKTVKNVCIANAEYIAVFEKVYIEYTVEFVNYDGTVISSKTYHYGDELILPEEPTREDTKNTAYKFVGWGTVRSLVVDDVTYTAQYTESPIAEKGVMTIKTWLFVVIILALAISFIWALVYTIKWGL